MGHYDNLAGVGQKAARTTASECSAIPQDTARLQTMLDGLRMLRDVTQQHGDRLRAAMDFVLGSEPQPPSAQGGNLVGSPVGMAGQIHELLLFIAREAEEVGAQIRRLERVVG